jgi:hypothetical protein
MITRLLLLAFAVTPVLAQVEVLTRRYVNSRVDRLRLNAHSLSDLRGSFQALRRMEAGCAGRYRSTRVGTLSAPVLPGWEQ